jgi:hypothetical protein
MMERDTTNSVMAADGPLKAFAARLNDAMSAAEHNHRSLGPKVGAHYNTVGHWARGERWPDTKHLGPVAVALNVSVDWLLTGREPAISPRGAVPANAKAVQLARELSDLAPALSELATRAKKVAAGS